VRIIPNQTSQGGILLVVVGVVLVACSALGESAHAINVGSQVGLAKDVRADGQHGHSKSNVALEEGIHSAVDNGWVAAAKVLVVAKESSKRVNVALLDGNLFLVAEASEAVEIQAVVHHGAHHSHDQRAKERGDSAEIHIAKDSKTVVRQDAAISARHQIIRLNQRGRGKNRTHGIRFARLSSVRRWMAVWRPSSCGV
jgi:hypothetical protein